MAGNIPHDRKAAVIAALSGGWVADAASLGLHWLYDSQRISEVGGQAPEFLLPRADYYAKGFGYFAHEGKQVGDVSHYGAATGVLTDSLLANNGNLDIRDYQRRFRTFFGPGGHWRGYIDNPTRITLENLNTIERNAVEQAQADVHLAETIDRHMVRESGADDMQLPAVSKLPPLVACYCGDSELSRVTEAAVRVTNHNDVAVAWAKCAAVLLDRLFQGESLSDAMDAAITEAPDQQSLHRAREGSELNGVVAGDNFGRTCYLPEAMPVSFHILTHAQSYTDAIRANIHCGGDSCGRAWLIGPAMAAIHGIGGKAGVPLSWLARLTDAATVYQDIESLVYGS